MEDSGFDRAYRDALALAKQRLLECDINQCCMVSGAVLKHQTGQSSTVELRYMNMPVHIKLPECSCTTHDGAEMHVWDKIMILHYLCTSQTEPPEHREVSFKQLKSAGLYFSSFQNRCLRPLEKVSGSDTDLLIKRVTPLGGEMVQGGDCAVRLQVLPKVPITIVLWKRDDEFPASANIIFDSSIEYYLSAEDIVVMCQRVVLKVLGVW